MLRENSEPIRNYLQNTNQEEDEQERIKKALYPNLQKEKEDKAYRNQLLHELRNDLTPAKVLYADINELEKIKAEKQKSTNLTNQISKNIPNKNHKPQDIFYTEKK